ncbi:hypothetical protein D3C86_2043620 [compost metagenome]
MQAGEVTRCLAIARQIRVVGEGPQALRLVGIRRGRVELGFLATRRQQRRKGEQGKCANHDHLRKL